MERIINTLYKRACRKGLEELAQLGSGVAASARGCAGLLEASQRPDEPVEAINGGTALGLCNLEHYIVRCLIHSGQLHTRINALQNTKSS